MIHVLSFGAGVQSVCVARMSLDGELPPLNHLIFADTGAEWPETYISAAEIEAACHNRGIGFHHVTCHYARSSGNLFEDLERGDNAARWAAPPLYIENAVGREGMTKRQCTGDYKIDPIKKKVRELAGIAPGSRGPKEPVIQRWLGISADEKQRMKAPEFRWESVWHPLIEGPRPMWRSDCDAWMRVRGYPVPVKSACVFCPYQSDRRWLELAEKHPEMFERCCRLDVHIRNHSAFMGTPYLHRSRRPLREAVATLREQRDRSPSFDDEMFSDECGGVCGV